MNGKYGLLSQIVTRRRAFVLSAALATDLLAVSRPQAESPLGTATAIHGDVSRKRRTKLEALAVGGDIINQDTVQTGPNSFAQLDLEDYTHILLGGETEFLVDSFIASQGGTMELGTGRMVFDRPSGSPKVNMSLRTEFGMIGVRGTKFFCGPSRGVFAVFVERGQVTIQAGGASQDLGPGDGIEIVRPGARPTNFARWAEARIREAYASVGLSR